MLLTRICALVAAVTLWPAGRAPLAVPRSARMELIDEAGFWREVMRGYISLVNPFSD